MNLSALFNLSYGLYVVSSKDEDKLNACIINSVFQVTAENPTIAISIAKNNLTNDYIKKSKVFTISVLKKDTPMEFIGHFGFKTGKNFNKFENVSFEIGKNEAPYLKENSLTFIEAKVINSIDVGTHTIYIGQIIECENIEKGEPLTYAYYHKIKGGKSPKNAPTFAQQSFENLIKNNIEKSKNVKYICNVCGYIYNPEIGDPKHNIEAGTKFEDLPKSWKCPVCGVGKDRFSQENK